MRWTPLAIALVGLAGLAACGCLCREFTEYHFTRGNKDEPDRVRIVQRHIESDAHGADERRTDFEMLISTLTSDAYLVEAVGEGLYVRDRTLAVEHGELVSSETALLRDLRATPIEIGSHSVNFAAGDTLAIRLPASALVSTDGLRLAQGDSVWVAWPKGARALEFVLRDSSFAPDPGSGFVKRYRAWQRKH